MLSRATPHFPYEQLNHFQNLMACRFVAPSAVKDLFGKPCSTINWCFLVKSVAVVSRVFFDESNSTVELVLNFFHTDFSFGWGGETLLVGLGERCWGIIGLDFGDFRVEKLPWCAGGGVESKLGFIAREVQIDKLGRGQGGGGLGDKVKLDPPFPPIDGTCKKYLVRG